VPTAAISPEVRDWEADDERVESDEESVALLSLSLPDE
jgi:hypothetical protein